MATWQGLAGMTLALPGSQKEHILVLFGGCIYPTLIANVSLLLIRVADFCHNTANASPNATLSAKDHVGTWNV